MIGGLITAMAIVAVGLIWWRNERMSNPECPECESSDRFCTRDHGQRERKA